MPKAMKYDPYNILIVEDEAAHAELTRRAIRKAGNANRIDVVGDGEEALDYSSIAGDLRT
ncbi:MAG: response regulator [Syntrophobacteraceae bacterium]|nr:response regulator [Syntrophobacteraceae bacterium]